MKRFRSYTPPATLTRYRELWLRLLDFFPVTQLDLEQGHEDAIIKYETYRYKAVVDGEGYMVWVLSSSQMFWEKAVLPLLAEYKKERITWSHHRYNPRAFLVKLPLNTYGVQSFREWAKSGSTDTTSFIRESVYDDGWAYADEDYWSYLYEDELDEMEEQCEEIEAKFERKTRRRK